MDHKYSKPNRAKLRSALALEKILEYVRNGLILFISLLLLEQVVHFFRHTEKSVPKE